ncbi:MAG: hypothetical protein CMO74_00965 [Verrucomicrobiales bacterium]|nr:hypothetical protein [Verrucomicrobiales bacterium]|tara:strand:- start:12347 stop:13696 length:1350 start_codon:yes stop_codon:yes gene_type:complete
MGFNLAKLGYSCYSLIGLCLLSVTVNSAEPPVRVVAVHNASASRPATSRAYFKPQPREVRRMVDAGVRSWTGKDSTLAAWQSLVTPKDVIGLKVNAGPGPVIGTRPEVARAVVASLIDAGIPRKNIVIWDKFREDLHASGFFRVGQDLGVEVAGAEKAGFERSIYHTQALVAPLERGDLEFGELKFSPRSHLTRLVAHRFTSIIQISSLLHHTGAGVDGCLHGLAMGSVDNTRRFKHLKVHLDNAVPAIHHMAAKRGIISINDYGKKLKSGKLAALVPPGIKGDYSFYYEAEDSENALPPLRALGLAHTDAMDEKIEEDPQVIIVSPDEKHDWQLTFHKNGSVEYLTTRSKIRLHIVDALLCQFSGGGQVRLQYTTVMNELRFSDDPVALDVLSLRDIERQAKEARFSLGPVNRDISRYAALLRLGTDNPDRIRLERVSLPVVFPGNRE